MKKKYLERKLYINNIVKLLNSTPYDDLTTNEKAEIYQFNYGNDGLDSEKIVIVNGKPQICDINRIINHLNFEYETTK